jgi:glyoxylase-like metal-dependent hydrolase (beta-lactamase superfamily II)
MELIKLTESCYYVKGAVNIGYITKGNKGMLIDAGIDKATSKKVKKILEENELPLTHLFITHAHADHYGGAHNLQNDINITTIAPPFEEAVMKYPNMHPMLMNLGNENVKELKNKFLQGNAIKVDKICTKGVNTIDGLTFTALHFPGHSHFQMGILFDNILYAADSYFGSDALRKHKIPFIVDAEQTLNTLQKLTEITCDGAVPGHGSFEENFHDTVKINIQLHNEIYESIIQLLKEKKLTMEELLCEVCLRWKIPIETYMSYALYRTSINAYVIHGMNNEDITYQFFGNKLYYHNKE